MSSYADKMDKLTSLKADLVDNLNSKGVQATSSEKFNTLVPKVLEIPQTGINTSDATATASDMLSGATAYVKGTKITGTIPSKSAMTYTPNATEQTIDAGQYLEGKQVIKGDVNLVAGNIKAGVKLFNVTGTHTGADDLTDATATAEDIKDGLTAYGNGGELITGTAHTVSRVTVLTPGTESNYLSPGFYNGVSVVGSPALTAGNIRQGVEIFGVVGTYSGGGGDSKDIVIFAASESSVDTYGNDIFVKNTDGTVLNLSETVRRTPAFCDDSTGYALNYSYTVFGWGADVPTISTNPITITSDSLIVVSVNSGATEPATVRLIRSSTGDVEDIMSQFMSDDGDYVDINYNWVYSGGVLSTAIDCSSIPPGTYYLGFIGKSDNAAPKISKIVAFRGGEKNEEI